MKSQRLFISHAGKNQSRYSFRTKFIVVVDEDVDVRNWKEVAWAMTNRMDPTRNTLLIKHTPIDFAPPVSGLGSKIGMDATNKWPGETQREWGRTMAI